MYTTHTHNPSDSFLMHFIFCSVINFVFFCYGCILNGISLVTTAMSSQSKVTLCRIDQSNRCMVEERNLSSKKNNPLLMYIITCEMCTIYLQRCSFLYTRFFPSPPHTYTRSLSIERHHLYHHHRRKTLPIANVTDRRINCGVIILFGFGKALICLMYAIYSAVALPRARDGKHKHHRQQKEEEATAEKYYIRFIVCFTRFQNHRHSTPTT